MNIFEPKIKPNMYYLIIIMEDIIKWTFSNHNTSLLTFPKSINFTKVINKGHTTFQAATLCASYQFYHSLKLNLWNSDLKKHQLWEISFLHLCYHHYYGITLQWTKLRISNAWPLLSCIVSKIKLDYKSLHFPLLWGWELVTK